MTVFGRCRSGSVHPLDADDDPQWLRVLVFVAAAAVAAFGSVGLLLAVLGWYRRLAVLGGGVVVLAGLCLLARRARGAAVRGPVHRRFGPGGQLGGHEPAGRPPRLHAGPLLPGPAGRS